MEEMKGANINVYFKVNATFPLVIDAFSKTSMSSFS